MAVMRRFLFLFSVRLGSVLVGILSLIQAAIWLMISLITIKNQEDVRVFLQEFVHNLGISNDFMLAFAANPSAGLVVLAVFASAYLIACVLVIIGSLTCRHKLLYPFLVLDFVYINLILLLVIMMLINFEKRGYGIGTVVMYGNLGAIFIVILLYLWTCVFSLLQVINELRTEIAEQRILLHDGSNQMKRMIDMRYRAQPNQYATTE